MNVKFHKNCENTSKILKISCVRCNFVKFDIHFLMTSYNEGSFFLVARERTLGTRLVFTEATTVVSRPEKIRTFKMLYFQNERCYGAGTCTKIYFSGTFNLMQIKKT